MRLCKPGFMETYLEYTSNQESPKEFHRWVALSIIGAVIGRSIWIPRVKYTTYPNLYVIIVAGSAKCRKSIALSIGKNILSSLEAPPMMFAQKITTEALIQALHEENKQKDYCDGIICASELSVFLGGDAVHSGIIPTLTDLYDSPSTWTYHTRGRGKEELKNVTLSLLGASTRDWLRTSIPEEAIGGGFTSRIIFVCEDAPSRLILFPGNMENDETIKAKLVHDLSEISKLTGAIHFSAEAQAVAIEWYEREAIEIRNEKTDGYYGRKHDTMFKVATILSVAESAKMIVEAKHIKEALRLMEINEKHLPEILESVTSNSFGGNTEKIFKIIKRFGKIKHQELLRKCWRYANASDLSEIMKTLTESGEVEQFLDKENKRWYGKS